MGVKLIINRRVIGITPFTRCHVVTLPECPAEMCSVIEAPSEAYFGNGQMCVQRTGKITPAPFQPTHADILTETAPGHGEQLLQRTAGNTLQLGYFLHVQIRIRQFRFHCLAQTVEQRDTPAGSRRPKAGGLITQYAGNKEFRQDQFNRPQLRQGQMIQRPPQGTQGITENLLYALCICQHAHPHGHWTKQAWMQRQTRQAHIQQRKFHRQGQYRMGCNRTEGDIACPECLTENELSDFSGL